MDTCIEHAPAHQRDKDGYGYVYVGHGREGQRRVGAHRVAWEKANGRTLLPGEVVRHSCDNPPCVNPAHLLIGTIGDNNRDMAARGRHWAQRRTAFGCGHLIAETAIPRGPDGRWRQCGVCSRIRRLPLAQCADPALHLPHRNGSGRCVGLDGSEARCA